VTAEKQDRNETPSRNTADIPADSQRAKERASRIQRVREEIRKVIEREYAISGKFQGLLTSFEAIIPGEKQRYEAALQALSTALNLSQQEIVESVSDHIEELSILEYVVEELFEDIGTKMTFIKERIEKPGVESKETAGSEQKSATPGSSEPDTSGQEKCPVCGRQMHFHAEDKRWLCYACAFEVPRTNEAQGKSEKEPEQAPLPGKAPAPSFAVPLASMIASESPKSKKGASSFHGLPAGKKTCPRCQKKMDWHAMEKLWKCFFCNHKTRY
jgi:ribosomal protein L37AE/L43A